MKTLNNKYNENRIISLWAFSESILGGFLHLFKIPFTGLLIGGLAIVFLSLLSFNNSEKKSILKGTIIVLIIKFVISPYTPINAFFSVALQGLLCYIFSVLFANRYLRIISFALTSMLAFSLQKLITIQILFGDSLWNAVDSYSSFIAKQFGVMNYDFSISLLLIAFYILMHIISGIVFSFISFKILDDLNNDCEFYKNNINVEAVELFEKSKDQNKNKTKRFFYIFFIPLIIFTSYFIKPEEKFINYFLVLVRFISIFILWNYIIAPILKKITSAFFSKKQNLYRNEVNNIIANFDYIKKIAHVIWNEIKIKNGIVKYFIFIRVLVVIFIKEN